MKNSNMIIETVIVTAMIILMSVMIIQYHPSVASGVAVEAKVDWEQRYHDQKRKSFGQYKRIKVLNGRVSALRGAATPLQLNIARWVQLASCESGNNWKINSGNGFFGGVQFDGGTWRSYGGRLFARSADKASPVAQVAIAEKVLARQGRGAWPACSKSGAW